MKIMKINRLFNLFSLMVIFLFAGNNTSKAQDCNGQYQCWIDKAFKSLKQQQFIEAADKFKAAQACDDAPYPDTIKHWIDSAYQYNIRFVDAEKANAKERVKDGKRQEIAYKITSDFIKTGNSNDLSLQLLLLHHACRTTNNSNKLAMKTRRDILSEPNNLFYKDVKVLNTFQDVSDGSVHKFSQDRKKHIIISDYQVVMKYDNEKPDVVIQMDEPIVASKSDLSANGKYLLVFTSYLDVNKKKNTSILHYRFSLYNTDDGKIIPFYNQAVHTAAFSPSGDSLLLLTPEGRFILRGVVNDGKTAKMSRFKIDSIHTISCLTMTRNGKHFITGTKNGDIILWNIKGKRVQIFSKKHGGSINTLIVSADDKHIISGSDDNTAIVWTLASNFLGNKIYEKECHVGEQDKTVSTVALSPNADYIITGGHDNKVHLWDKKGKLLQSALGHKNPLNTVSFSNDGQFFYTQDNETTKTWAFKPTKVSPLIDNFDIKDTFDFYDNIVISPNKQSIFIKFSKKNQVKAIWKDKTGENIVSFDQYALKIYQPTFSPDSRLLCFQYGRDSFQIWLQNGQLLKTFKANGAIYNISFSPDSRYLLINNRMKASELYAVDGFKKLKDFNVNPQKYNNVAFSPDSRYVMEIQQEGLAIFDLENFNAVHIFKEAFKKNKTIEDTTIYAAQIISIVKDTFLIMVTNQKHEGEFWRFSTLNNQKLFGFGSETFTNIKSLDNGNYFYYETINDKSVIQSKIRRTKNVDTVIATFPKPLDDFFIHKTQPNSELLYGLTTDEIYEINLKEPTKNIDPQPAISFKSSNNYSNIQSSFSQEGDTLFVGNSIYPNSLKLLNENKYIPSSILTMYNKRQAGILTDKDCEDSETAEDLRECALYYAQNATEDTTILSQYEDFITKVNNRLLLDKKEDRKQIETFWQYLREGLAAIVSGMEYEKNFPQKIAYTKKIIAIYENYGSQVKNDSSERAIQYSNLSWYILMDTDPDKVQKALIHGEKAVALDPQDWIVANLGHAHLFNNDLENAKESYAPLLFRYKDILKDLDIFEKAGAIPPQLKEIREWVEQEGVKKTQ